MVKVGILGSTGYVGAELARLIENHPKAELIFLDSRTYGGENYIKAYPSLRNRIENKCVPVDLNQPDALDQIDVLFCALPHGLSQKAVQVGLEKDLKVIDMSADFRISDPTVYETWYHTKHQAVDALKRAAYGLTEIHREDIKNTQLVANPGCYPTSIILALYPLLKEKAVSLEYMIVDSVSGVSGAGRNLNDGALYAQCNENFKAYGLGTHRHTPEIEQELSLAANQTVMIQFTPHLAPMSRGILSTIYLKNTKGIGSIEIEQIYRQYYGDEYFIRLLYNGELPQTKAVSGSNYCDLAFTVDQRTGNLILVSAIDNLMKGAAGQGVQNMNVLFGLEETLGINQMPVWP